MFLCDKIINDIDTCVYLYMQSNVSQLYTSTSTKSRTCKNLFQQLAALIYQTRALSLLTIDHLHHAFYTLRPLHSLPMRSLRMRAPHTHTHSVYAGGLILDSAHCTRQARTAIQHCAREEQNERGACQRRMWRKVPVYIDVYYRGRIVALAECLYGYYYGVLWPRCYVSRALLDFIM